MDSGTSQEGHIVEIQRDLHDERNTGRPKVCGDTPCGFSDTETMSKEAADRSASMRKLLIAVVLCIIFMSVEVYGGIKANSLAILTDAAHLLSDVAAFAISLFSLWAAGWEATPRQSYGFFRVEILGTLVSIQLIWVLAGILVYEAILRLIHDTGEVDGFIMFIVATFGLAVNIIMAVLLGHDHGHAHGHSHGDHGHSHSSGIVVTRHNHHHQHQNAECEEHHHHSDHGHDHDDDHAEPLLEKHIPDNGHDKKRRNINVHGAYLHVLGDSVQSIGVMVAGAIIWYKPEWKIIDLVCTLIFSVIVLSTTIKLLRDILEVLMESTPREIDATQLESGLLDIEDVVAIHELHIWAITVGKILLACHVKIKTEADADTVLDRVIEYIQREYNISHVTIQIERQ